MNNKEHALTAPAVVDVLTLRDIAAAVTAVRTEIRGILQDASVAATATEPDGPHVRLTDLIEPLEKAEQQLSAYYAEIQSPKTVVTDYGTLVEQTWFRPVIVWEYENPEDRQYAIVTSEPEPEIMVPVPGGGGYHQVQPIPNPPANFGDPTLAARWVNGYWNGFQLGYNTAVDNPTGGRPEPEQEPAVWGNPEQNRAYDNGWRTGYNDGWNKQKGRK